MYDSQATFPHSMQMITYKVKNHEHLPHFRVRDLDMLKRNLIQYRASRTAPVYTGTDPQRRRHRSHRAAARHPADQRQTRYRPAPEESGQADPRDPAVQPEGAAARNRLRRLRRRAVRPNTASATTRTNAARTERVMYSLLLWDRLRSGFAPDPRRQRRAVESGCRHCKLRDDADKELPPSAL